MNRAILLLLLSELLVSCNPNLDYKKLIPQHVDKFATGFVENLQKGNIDTCLSQVSNEMNNKHGKDYLTTAYESLQGVRLDSIRIINAEVKTFIGDNGFTNYLR